MFTPETINILLFAGIGFVFYFFIIRPQAKKAREMETFRDKLEKGMQVVTSGGLHGKIVHIDQLTVNLEVSKGSVIKIEKASIASDLSSLETPTKEK